MNLTAQMLFAAAPHAHADIVLAIVAGWPVVSAKYGLTTRNRTLGFLSTASEESGGFAVLSENLNYSATRAHQGFPCLFPTVEVALPYAFNPISFANLV